MEKFAGERVVSSLPALIILVPFIASIIVYFLTRYRVRLGEYFALGTIAVMFVAIFSMYGTVNAGNVIFSRFEFFAIPFSIYFRMDMLSFYLSLLIAFLWFVSTLHSVGYMAKEHAHERYYCFLLLALGGCMGTVFAGDLLGLFVFFEIMALASYVLVAHEEHTYAMFAGAKYLFMSIGAGLAIFLGLVITYQLAGTLTLDGFGLIQEVSTFSLVAFIGFLLGFGIKAGIFPVHIWLPDAHPAAPSPVSALLSGVMIKVGAYGLIRVFYQVYGFEYIRALGWDQIALVLSTITILLGSALALLQDDLKRRLAYSSIAQIGYIVLGISLLSERAFTGALYHIFSHAFMKGCLFMIAGALIVKAGERRISYLGGIGRKMPITMIAFTLCSLSMVGIPPFNGFISKWQLSLGALDIGQPFYVGLLIVSSLLNSAYYFPIVVTAFFGTPKSESEEEAAAAGTETPVEHAPSIHREGLKLSEAPLTMLVPIAILAVGSVLFVLMPQNWPLNLAKAVVQELFISF